MLVTLKKFIGRIGDSFLWVDDNDKHVVIAVKDMARASQSVMESEKELK